MSADIDKEREKAAQFLRDAIKLHDEWAADRTAQTFGTSFKAWFAAKYPCELTAARASQLTGGAQGVAWQAADSARLDWLDAQIVDVIYLDDGRIIDARGNPVRPAIDAVRAAPTPPKD